MNQLTCAFSSKMHLQSVANEHEFVEMLKMSNFVLSKTSKCRLFYEAKESYEIRNTWCSAHANESIKINE